MDVGRFGGHMYLLVFSGTEPLGCGYMDDGTRISKLELTHRVASKLSSRVSQHYALETRPK